MRKIAFHEYASIFPMIAGAEFESLVCDIKKNGLFNSITLYEDKILDGRNRYTACIEAGVDPTFEHYVGDCPLDYVISLNIERRQLTSTQKAIAAVDALPMYEKEAKRRQAQNALNNQPQSQNTEKVPDSEKGESREKVAKKFGTNSKYVSDAKKIKKDNPDLYNEMKDGKTTIADVKKQNKKAKLKAKVKANKEADKSDIEPIIYHMNSLEFLSKFDNKSVDLLLTDPPYSTDVDDMDGFVDSWLFTALDKVKKTGRAYICIGAYPSEIQLYLNKASQYADMELMNILVWTYRNTMGPTPKKAYKLNWQAILYFVGKDAPNLDSPLMTEQFSVQDINAPDGRQGDRYHAWQKPAELAQRFIRHSTKPGDTIIDPFSCTGTFLVEAAKLGRIASGCDIDESVIEIAKERGCKSA